MPNVTEPIALEAVQQPPAAPHENSCDWRKWLRFSLRTLLLFSLSIGAGATLWWNWQPWAPAYSIDDPWGNPRTLFSPDDRAILLGQWGPGNIIQLRDAATGHFRRAFYEDGNGHFEFSPGGAFLFYAFEKDGRLLKRAWHAATGDPVKIPDRTENAWAFEAVSPHDHLALINKSFYKAALVTLPDFANVLELKNDYVKTLGVFSNHEKWLAFQSRGAIRILSTETGRELKRFETDEPVDRLFFSPDDEHLFFICDHHHVSEIFETRTWTKLAEYYVVIPPQGISGDGKYMLLLTQLPVPNPMPLTFPVQRLSLLSMGSEKPLWSLESNQWDTFRDVRFSRDGTRVLSEKGEWDVQTGQALPASLPATYAISPDQKYMYVWDNANAGIDEIRSAATGQKLFDFTRFEFRPPASVISHTIQFANASGWLISRGQVRTDTAVHTDDRQIVWKMRRPVEWWGAAWLPEFWMAVALVCSTLWSVWCDHSIMTPRRRLKSITASRSFS